MTANGRPVGGVSWISALHAFAVLVVGLGAVGCGRAEPMSSRAAAPDSLRPDTVRQAVSYQAWTTDSISPTLVSADTTFGQVNDVVAGREVVWVLDLAGAPAIHVLDRSDGAVRAATGRRGEGPGEFINATEISAPADQDTVWVFDGGQQRMTGLRLDDSTHLSLVGPIRLDFPATPRRAIRVGQGFVAWITTPKEQLVFFNGNGRAEGTLNALLLGTDEIPYRQREILSTSNALCASPDGMHMAIAYLSAGRVTLVDVPQRTSHQARVPFPSDALFERDSRGDYHWRRPMLHYVACAATNDALYALYSGQVMPIPPPPDKAGAPEAAHAIHVFDWAGRLQSILLMSEQGTGLAIDPDGRYLAVVDRGGARLYGVSLH